MTPQERKHRIATLKREHEHRRMLNSIAPVTDECTRLDIPYSLFPRFSA